MGSGVVEFLGKKISLGFSVGSDVRLRDKGCGGKIGLRLDFVKL